MKKQNIVCYKESDKYLILGFLKSLGIKYSVSGYYDGYYIGFECTAADVAQIEKFLTTF